MKIVSLCIPHPPCVRGIDTYVVAGVKGSEWRESNLKETLLIWTQTVSSALE